MRAVFNTNTMSSSDTSTQFFPPILKRISISFFAILIICIALIVYFSPQSLFQRDSITKGDNKLQPQATVTPPTDRTLAQSTITTPSPANDSESSTTQESISTKDGNESNIPTAPPAASPEQPSTHSNPAEAECSGNSKPIKGVMVDGKKLYFKLGMQEYYTISELLPISKLFCNELDAKADGWTKASSDL